MQTDRELLELAAKAAGFQEFNPEPNSSGQYNVGPAMKADGALDDGHWIMWNPLTDDGDALRLAVKLCIGLDHNRAGDQQRYVAADRPGCEGCFSPVCAVEDEFDESQRAAATRLAIVRAAAEIGSRMNADAAVQDVSQASGTA
jgi:hypothetical protein